MTELVYLTDSYLQELKTEVVSCTQEGKLWKIILEKTIFYPQGGGQLSDIGDIIGPDGTARVKHVRMQDEDAVHECSVHGSLATGQNVTCQLDWQWRYLNMRRHSAGHIVHEAVMQLTPQLKPLRASHGKQLYIEYTGSLPLDKKYEIERTANTIVQKNLPFKTEIVSYAELTKRVPYIAGTLPKNKPLRILAIGDFPPMPDGGTQVKTSGEVGEITIARIANEAENVRVYYSIEEHTSVKDNTPTDALEAETISTPNFVGQLLDVQRDALGVIQSSNDSILQLRLGLLGPKSMLANLIKQMPQVSQSDRQQVGIVINEVKRKIEKALQNKQSAVSSQQSVDEWFDATQPGIRPPEGHLHIITQAITEITRIFERIGFVRVRHPEVDWDWYAFESLNMPLDHPARDEWETFHIKSQKSPAWPAGQSKVKSQKYESIVLTPHTSNGQVREMEKGKLPIRMINIAKCYRRQTDVSHVPMFHQFEGMYIDKNVSIGHLKGFINYFVKQFFGPERKFRLRPFHFQFTEPSFEVDISCANCEGKGCRLCKDGWLELAGSGMIHPVVLKNGGIDPDKYSGFAIGWGVERTYMMKSGTQLDDIRLLYGNDVRFLEQF